ncbi:MAG: prenyltransferase [Chloroflexi bacterium]|nr:prenyltransferase [Chloroflexota bacterium]
MTATLKTAAPRLWLQALYTIPRIDLAEADSITRWLILSRASVLVMTAISGVIGGLLAARDDAFDGGLLVLAVLGLVLAHAASNLTNDMWDFARGVDTPDSPRATYGPHALTHATAEPGQFVIVTAAVLAAATAIGVYLVVAAGPGVLAFALPGAFILLLYSGGPYPLKYYGLGELAVLMVWGPLMIGGTYYVMAEELPGWVVLASLPYAFGVTSVLMGKHVDKLAFDSEKGIHTLPRLIGEARARRLTQGLIVLMYFSTLALAAWQMMPGLVLSLGALPLAFQVLPAFSSPKPTEPPKGFRGWPLWFVGFAFVHNRRFGLLFVTGLALQVVVETVAGAV